MQALIDDLTSRAKNLQVSENDLAKARYRAELVRVVRLLDLLKEGNPSGGKNLTREQSSECADLPIPIYLDLTRLTDF